MSDSTWVEITPAPDELEAVNDTGAAKALGGIARVRLWWQPSTGRIVARLTTTHGAEMAEQRKRVA